MKRDKSSCKSTPKDRVAEAKRLANRRNARKSTGPKTAAGKARSSKNALKHGLAVATPVIPGIESRKAWKKHLTGILESFRPTSYAGLVLVVQFAIVSWRLNRVFRYEAEVIAAAITGAEQDLEDRSKPGSGKPTDPAEAHAKNLKASWTIEVLEALPKMADGERLDKSFAVVTLISFCEEFPELGDIPIPGIPNDNQRLVGFDHRTAGLLRKAIGIYAAALQMTPEDLVEKRIASAREERDNAEELESHLVDRERRWKLVVKQEKRRRMILESSALDTVIRYEGHLTRSCFKILHEIQRLQASQSGEIIALPAALDVDLTVQEKEPSE